jgi:hypothetical protein
MLKEVLARLLILIVVPFGWILCPNPAGALDVVDAQDRYIRIRIASPIHNLTDVRVWRSRYDPSDALPEKMTQHFQNLLKSSPMVEATLLDKEVGAGWPVRGYGPNDVVVKVNLEDLKIGKKDLLGSEMSAVAYVRMTVYGAVSKEPVYTWVSRSELKRWTPEYRDLREPFFWKDFEASVYWSAVKDALNGCVGELVSLRRGYRILGRIVAVARPADGLAWDRNVRRFHVNLGAEDTLREGDVLPVMRSTVTRTADGEEPVMLYPQRVGMVRVVYASQKDGVVEVVEEPKESPIGIGDVIMVPLTIPRKGLF